MDVSEQLAELKETDTASDSFIQTDVEALSALANDARYQIGRILHTSGEGLCVCEFSRVRRLSSLC